MIGMNFHHRISHSVPLMRQKKSARVIFQIESKWVVASRHKPLSFILRWYLQKMLKIKYDPVHGHDYIYDNADRTYMSDYRIRKPYDFYFDWPWRYRVWFPNRAFRRYLNKEFRVSNLYVVSVCFKRLLGRSWAYHPKLIL